MLAAKDEKGCAMVDQFLDPDRLTVAIQERDLFPEADPLKDPFGEPPPNRVWDRSVARSVHPPASSRRYGGGEARRRPCRLNQRPNPLSFIHRRLT